MGRLVQPPSEAPEATMRARGDGPGWTLLIVDDDPQILRALARLLGRTYRVVLCESGRAALQALESHHVGVILTDQVMPEMSGFELLRQVRARYPDSPMVRVVLSAHSDFALLENFVNECQIGHFVSKPFNSVELLRIVAEAADSFRRAQDAADRALQLQAAQERLARENRTLRARLGERAAFEEIVGHSNAIREMLSRVDLVRRSEVSAHVFGETGTGKELVARAIHHGGPRASKPFVVQNCAGLDESLLHSTLFGHSKGAFTGATRDHAGVFQQAHQGTLFLDEVADLSAASQAALLRALQEGEVVPLGATAPVRVDVRILSATHVDLRQAVHAGRFREDLYYRLVVVGIDLPPLRVRQGDIPVLLAHFLAHHGRSQNKAVAGFSPEALEILERYHWPGNVRELSHEVQRLVVLTKPGERIETQLLSPNIRGAPAGVPLRSVRPSQAPAVRGDGTFIPFDLSYDEARDTLARRLIARALAQSGGVVRSAADALGMERSRLAKLRRRLGVASET